MVTTAAKREAAANLYETDEVSQCWACSVVKAVGTSVRYHSRRSDDQSIRDRLSATEAERRRFGYRSLHILF